jgi:hypothetical protein
MVATIRYGDAWKAAGSGVELRGAECVSDRTGLCRVSAVSCPYCPDYAIYLDAARTPHGPARAV